MAFFSDLVIMQCWITHIWWTEQDQRGSSQPIYSHLPGGLGETISDVSGVRTGRW